MTCGACGAVRTHGNVDDGIAVTPCTECGATEVLVKVVASDTMSWTDSVSVTMTPADQDRDWRRRWGGVQARLADLSAPRTGGSSTEEIHAAADELHGFFVQAYHLKDALIAHAAEVGLTADAIETAVTNDPVLALIADLANSDKHSGLDRPPRSGTVPVIGTLSSVSPAPQGHGWQLRMPIEHGGDRPRDGLEVAEGAVDAWRQQLEAWGLV